MDMLRHRCYRVNMLVVAIGTIFSVIMAKWVQAAEYLSFQSQISEAVPPIPAFVGLAVLCALNRFLHLSRKQLMGIYFFTCLSVSFCGPGMVRPFLPAIAAPAYYDDLTPQAGYLFPHDRVAILGLYEGNDTGNVPWAAWFPSLLIWGGFLVGLYALMGWVLEGFRDQWVSMERLTFPLLALPSTITKDNLATSIAKPILWVGLLPVILFDLTNTLHAFDPTVPAIGDSVYGIRILPSILGIAYFIPTHILSGTVLNHFLLSCESKVAPTISGDTQAIGAYVVVCGLLLWRCRHGALRFLLGCVALSIVFAAMGMKAAEAVIGSLILLGFTLVYARLRCEAGAPIVWNYPYNFGNGLFASPVWATLNFLRRGYWVSSFAWQVESKAWNKPPIMTVAALAGLVCAVWIYLIPCYEYGINNLAGALPQWGGTIGAGSMWVRMAHDSHFAYPAHLNWGGMGLGAATVGLLTFLHRYFLRWPVHPLGFLLASTWGGQLWGMFAVAWASKSIATRLGGVRLYRALQPVFMGLFIGHYAYATVWSLLGIWRPDWGGRFLIGFG